MKRYLLPLAGVLLVVGLLCHCQVAARAPSVASLSGSSDAGNAATEKQDGDAPDAAVAAGDAVDAQAPSWRPVACQNDGGVESWVLVGRGCDAPVARLQWASGSQLYQLDADGGGGDRPILGDRYNGGSDLDPEHLFAEMQWFSELPDECVGVLAHVTDFKRVRDQVYRLTIFSHDYGGHGCHASYDRTMTGEVVLDGRGYLLKARFRGVASSWADNTPECLPIRATKPIAFELSRSCSGP